MNGRSFRQVMAIVVAMLTALLVLPVVACGSALGNTPVVLFPAFHLTKLVVTVDHQTAAPECPGSGRFEDWYRNDHPSTTFSQICQDKLLTLRYQENPATPMPARFADQPGVNVQILDYGKTQSAPFYEALYQKLESAGYVRNKDIRVAGYDARLTPDMAGFLQRTKTLVEDAYRDNGDRPVHLVGHSNGPLYAQYLLTHTTREWRDRYIHGFTPIAGNFPGQGLLYSVLFTGLTVEDFGYPKAKNNAESSARMYLTAPSTYLSAADPKVFADREVVVQDVSTGRSYTPRDYPQLFTDAKLPFAKDIADYYTGFVTFTDPQSFPYVDVDAEKGSRIPTTVGARLANLTPGQVVDPSTPFITRDGDINQEDITNDAVLAWRAMPCFHFSLTDNPGVDHFSLPSNPNLLNRLIDALKRTPTRDNCH